MCAQVLSNMLDWGMEPQSALDAPRWSLYGVDSAEGPVTVERSMCESPRACRSPALHGAAGISVTCGSPMACCDAHSASLQQQNLLGTACVSEAYGRRHTSSSFQKSAGAAAMSSVMQHACGASGMPQQCACRLRCELPSDSSTPC